jgi:hypothetical protein
MATSTDCARNRTVERLTARIRFDNDHIQGTIMQENIQDIEVSQQDGPMAGTVHKHPAFGQIVASRIQGEKVLYGSDLKHRNFVTIRITGSELHRSNSKDWNFERQQYVEVALSEAQWATFVSSMNMGGGTPCTLVTMGGKSIPQLPDPESRREQFNGELSDTMRDALAQLQAMRAELADAKISATLRNSMTSRIDMAIQEITKNVPFVAEQFDRHLEQQVERAKTEINAYATVTLMRAGLENHGGKGPVQMIDSGDNS